jgi:glycosidase
MNNRPLFFVSVSAFVLIFGVSFWACHSQQASDAPPGTGLEPSPAAPAWAKNANIYEVNLRQYTPEGTFNAFASHLPRLKKMGVDILWFMPVFPVSEARRKGTLGSYYAVADFRKVNPEFGTMEDFSALIQKIHALDMRIILDWVPNHTGWDHPWITSNPEYYTKGKDGQITDPINPKTGKSWGWTDVADLNYDNKDLRQAMQNDMLYWVREHQIDGFRCDVAEEVPLDFWKETTQKLRSVKSDLFMLAEAEFPPHRNEAYFAMSYGWSFHHLMNQISKGDRNIEDIRRWLAEDRNSYRKGYHMHFITNHDENSWNGTEFERLGKAVKAMAVLAFTFDGMPLIYSGQEAGLNKRLAFFEKDTISWSNLTEFEPFYTTLLDLKHRNRALWNGADGGDPIFLETDKPGDVLLFMREKEQNRVVVLLNLSPIPQETVLNDARLEGSYSNVFANSSTTITPGMRIKLNAWDYLVLVR